MGGEGEGEGVELYVTRLTKSLSISRTSVGILYNFWKNWKKASAAYIRNSCVCVSVCVCVCCVN